MKAYIFFVNPKVDRQQLSLWLLHNGNSIKEVHREDNGSEIWEFDFGKNEPEHEKLAIREILRHCGILLEWID